MPALGFDDSLFNIEFFVQADGTAKIVEVNGRMASQFAPLVRAVHGMSSYRIQLELVTGGKPHLPKPRTRRGRVELRVATVHGGRRRRVGPGPGRRRGAVPREPGRVARPAGAAPVGQRRRLREPSPGGGGDVRPGPRHPPPRLGGGAAPPALRAPGCRACGPSLHALADPAYAYLGAIERGPRGSRDGNEGAVRRGARTLRSVGASGAGRRVDRTDAVLGMGRARAGASPDERDQLDRAALGGTFRGRRRRQLERRPPRRRSRRVMGHGRRPGARGGQRRRRDGAGDPPVASGRQRGRLHVRGVQRPRDPRLGSRARDRRGRDDRSERSSRSSTNGWRRSSRT